MSKIVGNKIYETEEERDRRIAFENRMFQSGKRLSRNRAKRDTVRMDVEIRAHDKCEVCSFGFTSILHVHHIKPVSMGGSGSLHNLILLCRNCHGLAHHYSHSRRWSIQRYPGWKQGLAGAGLNEEQAEKLLLIASQEARVSSNGELRHYKEPDPLTSVLVDDQGNPVHRPLNNEAIEESLRRIEDRFGIASTLKRMVGESTT